MRWQRWATALAASVLIFIPVASCGDHSNPVVPRFDATTAAATMTGVEIRITENLAGQTDPDIAGNWIVYTDNRGFDADVWAYDIAARREFPVSTAPGDQQLSGIGDGRIVYTDYQTMDVSLYDIATGGTTNLTEGTAFSALYPDIQGDIVAWQERRGSNNDIWATRVGGTPVQVSTSERDDRSPAVGGDWIAWQSCLSGLCDIYIYNFYTGETRQVTATAADERNPCVDGAKVVYEGRRGADAEIYVYDIATGVETPLALSGDQVNANISGAYVSFEDLVTGVSRVKIWDLASGQVFQIGAPETSAQFLNAIDGTRVVYTDDRQGQLDIFMFEFTIASDVSVGAIRDQIAAYEQSGAITNHGIARSLTAFLRQVEAAIARGDTTSAAKTLDHFIAFCRQQTPRHISQAASDELIRLAELLEASLS